MHAAEFNDTELVTESLDGNLDAFRQIVERYQILISSLAYCATGNVNQSEDLAQETFVTAWKQLAQLREPAKLRPWLCGIARFLISNEFRRQGREPVHAALSLEEGDELISPEPSPRDHLITEEEKAILWRSLDRIPEIYREPLVLFYREDQSIEAVARDMELSEDAVKQRLSRGRKLLQEEFLTFVAGALKQTIPRKAFTLGVMAGLPLLATTAKAATAGATAAQSSAMAKATGLGAFLQIILKVVLPIGLFVSLAGWLGYTMGRDAASQSQCQRESVARFWGVLVASLTVFVVLPILLWAPLFWLFGSRENLHAAIRKWLDVMYAVMVVALAVWAWQRRKSRPQDSTGTYGTKKTFLTWSVVLAMIVAGGFLALGLSDTNWKVDKVSKAEAQKLILEKSKDAEFCVLQDQSGSGHLWIKLRENGKLSKLIAPADQSTLSLLAGKGIPCPIYVQGRDFEVFGWEGKLLMGLCLLILAAGAAVFLTLSVKNRSRVAR
jgi:RNA polymerase sigma factor (sigma-70 family)